MAKNIKNYGERGNTVAMAHPGNVGVSGPFAVTYNSTTGIASTVGDTLADAILAENAKNTEDVTE